jgi:hypothetical protein
MGATIDLAIISPITSRPENIKEQNDSKGCTAIEDDKPQHRQDKANPTPDKQYLMGPEPSAEFAQERRWQVIGNVINERRSLSSQSIHNRPGALN